MVQFCASRLDLSFSALSDATRRGVLEQVAQADRTITSLAAAFQMTLTGMMKHVRILEQAGLVTTRKIGRVRTCTLGQRSLAAEAEWIEGQRRLFEARFAALDRIILEMQQEEENGPAG